MNITESGDNRAIRTSNYFARIVSKRFLLLVVITTLDLRPIAVAC